MNLHVIKWIILVLIVICIDGNLQATEKSAEFQLTSDCVVLNEDNQLPDPLSSQTILSSNSNIRFTFSLHNVTIKEILRKIEAQSPYAFMYDDLTLLKGQLLSISVKNATIEEVLNKLFASRNVLYVISNWQIILKGTSEQQNTSNQHIVSGVVTDEYDSPLIGAAVSLQGTNQGTYTDANGCFQLTTSVGSVLEISYLGFCSKTVKVTPNVRHTLVILEEDKGQLDEVVVVGFGTQKKEHVTGAVEGVKMDKVLGHRPTSTVGASLQGAIAGFTVSPSAIPGGETVWNVRGVNSINGGRPLILVDNVVYTDLNLLNPSDIEEVSVLKDASSAAIYGARASFGVILITTKKAKHNEKFSLNYSSNFSISKISNLIEPASPIDFIRTLKDGEYTSLWSGQYINTYYSLLESYNQDPSIYPKGWTSVNGTRYYLRKNDVLGDMFETGWKQLHHLSAAGGSERINYRMSLGYDNEDGILITDKDKFTRVNVLAHVDSKITSFFTASVNIAYNNSEKKYPYLDESSELRTFWDTNLPSYFPVGTLLYGNSEKEYPVSSPANLIRFSAAQTKETDNIRILSRNVLKPFQSNEIFKDFQAVLEVSYEKNFVENQSYAKYFQLHQGLIDALKPSTTTNSFIVDKQSIKYTTLNAFADYGHMLGNVHHVYALVGFNQEKSSTRSLSAIAYHMINNDLPSISGGDGSASPSVSDFYDVFSLRSGFVRVNYNYDQRYFLEFNGRYDLSSKFPKAYRSGFFPSFSGAWNIGKERFIVPLSPFINSLKFRMSFGILGNQSIENYSYFPTMSIIQAPWIFNGKRPVTMNQPAMVRDNFGWERVESVNGGIDFGFLGNRLSGSFDVYSRMTKGMLGPSEDFPKVAGVLAPLKNSANLQSKGWELSLLWKDKTGQINYSLGFNIYNSRSYISRFKNETGLLSAPYYEGQELGEIWGYLTDGFYTSSDFDSNGLLKPEVVRISGIISHEGDIKYKNIRDDKHSINSIDQGDNTVYNPGDRTIIGNSSPHLQYAFNGFLQWKGFDFSFICQGVGKRDAWLANDITFPMQSMWSTVYQYQVGKIWTKDNPNAFYGRIYENAASSQRANQMVSDKFLYDASYLRVKNITLSYSFPRRFLGRFPITNLKVYVSGENLFTFDHLPKGIDPENLKWTYPYSRIFSFGFSFQL